METAEDLIRSLEDDWSSFEEILRRLLVDAEYEPEHFQGILKNYNAVIAQWAASRVRRVSSGKESWADAYDAFKSAVTELLLWRLYVEAEDDPKNNDLLGTLWNFVSKTIEFQAASFVGGRRRSETHKDQIDELMQEGFFRFQYMIEKYEPEKSMLRTFIGSCYRNHFINMTTSKATKDKKRERQVDNLDSKADKSTPQRHRQEEQRTQFKQEQWDRVEELLTHLANDNPDDAERVKAFRKHKIEGMTIEQVREETGRSVGWVHKSSRRIENLLRERLKD